MQTLRIVKSNRVADNAAFDRFLKALPDEFNTTGTEIHTARNRLRIMDVSAMGVEGLGKVMVKRYHGLFFFQKFDYTYIRRPKCRKAFENTAELRRRGFEAAEELAYVEVWNHGFYQYAFFVSEVGRGERLDHLVIRLQEEGRKDIIDPLIHQFAAHLKSMHEHGILYRDMNCGNVLCRQETPGGPWQFCMIDTNRARFYDEHQVLDMETVLPDLILMNPKMGTVEQFIAEYLKLRGCYSDEEVQRIRNIQRCRHEKKRPVKHYLKRYKKAYYKWLEG